MLTEAEGDQPGCLAALHEEAVAMGFAPLVYGNMKGFLNRSPTPEDMACWAGRNGISLPMVTSFTDGTKLQVEQCLVANGLGAGIAREELLGPATDNLAVASRALAEAARGLGRPISDYVLSGKLPHGVFIVATHDGCQREALRYLKLGDGPFYTLLRHNIFVHLEVFKTIERVLRGGDVLLDNGATPRIGVAAVAKRALRPGERIERGGGGFDLRGICVDIVDRPGHLPICLADGARVGRRLEPGQVIALGDVDPPDDRAWTLDLWRSIEARALAAAPAAAPARGACGGPRCARPRPERDGPAAADGDPAVNTPPASAGGFSGKLRGNPPAWRRKARSRPEACSGKYVTRGVPVAVRDQAAVRAAVHPLGQALRHLDAASRAVDRRAPRVNRLRRATEKRRGGSAQARAWGEGNGANPPAEPAPRCSAGAPRAGRRRRRSRSTTGSRARACGSSGRPARRSGCPAGGWCRS